MNAIKQFNNLPETKEEVNNFFKQVKESFLNGEENALKRYVQFKSFESLLKMISTDKEIKATVLEEAGKHGAKTFVVYNAEIQIKESAAKYLYEDTTLELINEQIEKLKEQKKVRETMLKSLSGKVFEEETGEEIKPAIKLSSQTIISITLK